MKGEPLSPASPDSAALRCPKNAAGLRYSLRFSTAAEIAGSLFLPPAAAACNSTGRGAFFLFGKTKRKNGGRIDQPTPTAKARSFALLRMTALRTVRVVEDACPYGETGDLIRPSVSTGAPSPCAGKAWGGRP